MARILTNNIITAPAGLTRKYLDDYMDQTSVGAAALKGVGEAAQAVEDEYKDYLERKRKKEEDDYIKGRNKVADQMAAERFQMEKDRFQAEKDDRAQSLADRAERERKVSEFLAGEHPAEFDTIEGRTALQQYINDGGNSIANFRSQINTAEVVKKAEEASNAEKVVATKNEALKKEVSSIDLPLTKSQWENVKNPEEMVSILKSKRAEAVELGNREIQKDIEDSLRALYEGGERKVEKATTEAKKAKAKSDNKAIADLFG